MKRAEFSHVSINSFSHYIYFMDYWHCIRFYCISQYLTREGSVVGRLGTITSMSILNIFANIFYEEVTRQASGNTIRLTINSIFGPVTIPAGMCNLSTTKLMDTRLRKQRLHRISQLFSSASISSRSYLLHIYFYFHIYLLHSISIANVVFSQ